MKKITTYILAAVLFLVSFYANATIRYVRQNFSNNGTSWANASGDLQAMINASAPGDEVWVATGTYKPTNMPTGCMGCPPVSVPNYRTFFINNGVKIYGGFFGSETSLSQRNIAANPTTLSGDLDPNGNTYDCYHVVLAAAPSSGGGVTIDGFTITAGNASNGTPFSNFVSVNGLAIDDRSGGGIYIVNGINTIANNTVVGNTADYSGGGIYTEAGTNTFTNNTVQNNFATNFKGGGISLNGSNNTLRNNTVVGNIANAFAGGGGGIYSYNGINVFENNVLANNNGGGNGGGGIYLQNGTNTLTNNTLAGNTGNWGGGICTDGGTNTLTNNILWGNKTNTNSTTTPGSDYAVSPTATNGNTFQYNILQLPQANYLASNVPSNSLGTVATISTNKFAIDPVFVNSADLDGTDNIHRTADDGLALRYFSPALNTGTISPAPPTDITGASRTNSSIDPTDIGAYEWRCPSGNILYVDANIPIGGNGTTWNNDAFKTLDEALAVAHCCANITEIRVAKGTYKPTKKPYNGCTEITTSDPRDKTFHIPNGVKLLGGFPTGGGGPRNYKVNVTTLSGDFNGDDVVVFSGGGGNLTLSITGNAENAYHVVLAANASGTTPGVTIDGFTIKGGSADELTGSYITVNGIGIYRFAGGGVCISNGINNLRNNIIERNRAGSAGGLLLAGGTTTLMNNTISANLVNYNGGGIVSSSASATLTNNTIFGNACDISGFGGGGGIFAEFSNISMTNNAIAGNSATSGGGIYSDGCINTLINNTIAGNSAYSNGDGGGMFSLDGSGNTLMNNIFWDNLSGGNTASAGADFRAFSSPTTAEYNLFQTPNSTFAASPGNLFGTDPLFFNAADVDGADNRHRTADDGLRLQLGSPAINAGNPAITTPSTDIIGHQRIVVFEMGAYERWCPLCPVYGTHRSSTFYYNTYTIYLEEGTSPYLITWDNSGNVTYSIDTTQYGTTITILYDNNATWVCVISNINNGADPDMIFSNTFFPDAEPPLVSISSFSIASQTIGTPNGAIDITVSNTCTGEDVSYLWSGPSGFTATTQDIAELLSGWYVVEITGCNGEQTTGVYWVPLQTRGRGKHADETILTAYPNPFTQTATIAFTLPETTEAVLKVYSIDGREVAQLFNGMAEAGQPYTVELNGSGLAAGIYIAALTSQTGVQQRYRLVLTN